MVSPSTSSTLYALKADVVAAPSVDPARIRLDRDLVRDDFEGGVSAGLWRIVSFNWPVLIVALTAGEGNEVVMRLLVDDYPTRAPSGQPWHLATSAVLPIELWPISTVEGVVSPFRTDWSPSNGSAPYVACDRAGLATHTDWADKYPERAWNPGRTIAFYLSEMHRELQCTKVPRP